MTDLINSIEALAGKVTLDNCVTARTAAKAEIRTLCTDNLPTIIAALKVAKLVRDEEWLAERISDSLDVDWTPIDCARAIIAALPKETDNA